jgi:tRNA (guanine37-N1)-methyltransferase
MTRFDIITLFPEMVRGPFEASILKRAQDAGFLDVRIVDLRDFAEGKHKVTDDASYGGGGGMVLKPEPAFAAVEAMRCDPAAGCKERIVLLTPQGRPFSQKIAAELAREDHLILLCGHYEGVDERVREHLVDDEISIGDYVLTGGEVPAMVVVDAVGRLVPGVLGNEESPGSDSFSSGLLEHPQYTRPAEFRSWRVPEVLISGDHEKVRRWRREQSLKRTLLRRPDLLKEAHLTDEDRDILEELESELAGAQEERR